ncbi:MAG: bifunctional oligoribonuclease/PAP phosphatase NrnA [Bacteroidales bacterium]
MNLPVLDNSIADKLGKLLSDNSKRIVILTHVNPDGDAIGSSLGLYGFFKLAGFNNTDVIVPNNYASFLKWMPYNDNVIIAENEPKSAHELISGADIIFCLDFNEASRIDNLKSDLVKSSAQKVLIDHHPQPATGHFNIIISDTDSSSTAELIYIVIDSINNTGLPLNKDIAACLYAGIVTDTGSFSYASNNYQTYLIVAELIAIGVDAAEIHNNIYDTYSEDRMRLLGYCLSEKLKVLPNKKVAHISLSAKELDRFNYREGDTEGIVNYALSIKGIELAAFFMETEDVIKISFRSKNDVDVNQIARNDFNGGGHMNASGGRINASLEEAIAKFELLFSNELSIK